MHGLTHGTFHRPPIQGALRILITVVSPDAYGRLLLPEDGHMSPHRTNTIPADTLPRPILFQNAHLKSSRAAAIPHAFPQEVTVGLRPVIPARHAHNSLAVLR